MRLDRRVRHVRAGADACYATIVRIGGERGWYAYDWAWRLRGLMDRLIGGIGMRRGRRDPDDLVAGDVVDFWRVQTLEPGRMLQLRAEMKLPGRAWLRFDLVPDGPDRTELHQTAFFEPKGLAGVAYWAAVAPLHALIFPAMARAIARRAEAASGADR
jgi:hypothetical protein